MASLTLSAGSHPWAVGTTVQIQPDDGQRTEGAPADAPVTTALVSATSEIQFTGLADDTRYYAVAQVGSTWRWIYVRTDARVIAPGSAANIEDAGNLGSTYTLDMQGELEVWLFGTLSADCVLTITNRPEGGRALLVLAQDGTGGRELTLSDGVDSEVVVTAQGPGEITPILLPMKNGTDLYALPFSVPGPTGPQGATGATGATGSSGGGASSEDPNTFGAVSIDLANIDSSLILTSGTLHLTKVPVTEGFTLNAIHARINTAGSSLTAGQCFAAVYDSSGTRVAVTADQSGVWNSAGDKAMNVVTPVALSAGFYWVALLANGTTPPVFFSMAANNMVNTGCTAATARSGNAAGTHTTTPASITPASISIGSRVYGIGLK
jgi:hypothetical protein